MSDPRDLTPPASAPSGPHRPVELTVGWDLESLYQHYAEILTFLTWGVPPEQADNIADKGRRLTNHLADHGLRADQLAVLGTAVQNVTRHSDPRPADLTRWAKRQEDVARRLENLMVKARAVLPLNRRRYYDLGVMLNRVAYFAAMLRNSAANPGTIFELPTAVLDKYRAELSRVALCLSPLCLGVDVFGDGTVDNQTRDSEFAVLDSQLIHFALWLAEWRHRRVDPDDAFFERLDDILHQAGFYQLDGSYVYAAQFYGRTDGTAEPEEGVVPLGVPHSNPSLDALLTKSKAFRQDMRTEPHRFLDHTVVLLDVSRYTVGPAHPVTVEIQIDLAHAYAANKQLDRAIATCKDAVATVEHYYGQDDPTAYKIFASAYEFLAFADPKAARQLYEQKLRQFLEGHSERVPERLRRIHADLVRRLTGPAVSAGHDPTARA